MASVNLYLKEPNTNKNTPIIIKIYLSGKSFKISTGQAITPKLWNFDKKMVKKSYQGSFELNNLLTDMKNSVESFIRNALAQKKKINAIDVKNHFNNLYRNTSNNKSNPNSLFEYFNLFIERSKTTKKKSILYDYKAVINKLKLFEDKKRYRIDFDRINLDFYEKFIDYLLIDCNLINNTVGSYIKSLKTFLNWSVKLGINSNLEFRKFKVFREEVTAIYLTAKELNKIDKLKFKDKNIEIARDMFLVLCNTGLRYSDLINLKPENNKGDYLLIKTMKTKDALKIPLNKKVKEIISKYQGFNFKKYSNQTMNKYLKEIGKQAGIDDKTEKILYQGSKRIEKIKPKYEFIGTHTGRRTFITLSLEKGMRPEIVMRITGHKDYESFKKYIKLTDKVVSEEFKRVWD